MSRLSKTTIIPAGAIGLLFFLALPACSATDAQPPARGRPAIGGENAQKMENLRLAIEREVAVPTADDLSQCAALPLGARACGGPQSYVVYSRKVSNEARLQELAQQYTQLEREWNTKKRIISICSVVPAPQVVLVDGKCQAARSDGSGQPAVQ